MTNGYIDHVNEYFASSANIVSTFTRSKFWLEIPNCISFSPPEKHSTTFYIYIRNVLNVTSVLYLQQKNLHPERIILKRMSTEHIVLPSTIFLSIIELNDELT